MEASAIAAGATGQLESAYYVSQIFAAGVQFALVGVAIWAGWAAYMQLMSFKVFELLKYAQDETFRQARRAVIRDIRPIRDQQWWTRDLGLEASASDCCAHYDVLGRVLMFQPDTRLASFLDPWGPSIVRTYEAVLPFIEHRRENGGPDFRGYEWLYQEARRRLDKAGVEVV